jgi:hypothetical protein
MTTWPGLNREALWFKPPFPSSAVQWALDAQPRLLQDVHIDLSRLDLLVTQQFLHNPNVVTLLQAMSCKAVTNPALRDAIEKAFGDVRGGTADRPRAPFLAANVASSWCQFLACNLANSLGIRKFGA